MTNGWRERAGWLLAAALLAVVVFGYLMPVTRYFTAVPGGLGDARYNSVVLEHLYRVVTGYDAGLWDPGFYYPFKGVLAFSDNHFGSGASYVAARLLGLSREHAFDLWFIAGTLLNFASALYVLRRLGITTAAAALGAFFFTFAVPVPAQDTHAQLVHRFAAPLAVLALWQMFERRRLADLARAAFFTVWQFYCSLYLGLFLVYLLAALAVAILLVRKPFEWPQWRANLAAERASSKLAAGGLLLGSGFAFIYLIGHYFWISRIYELGRPASAITEVLPRPASYLIADHSPLLAWLARDVAVPARWEQQMFIGFGAIVLILTAAAFAWRRRAVVAGLTEAMLIALALLVLGTLWIDDLPFYRLIARLPGGIGTALGALALILAAIVAWRARAASPASTRAMPIALALLILGTLWIHFLSLYHLISWLPGVNAIRAVSRIILIMLVPMSVLVALGADAIWRRSGRSLRVALPVLAGLAAMVVAEPLSVNTGSTPIAKWRARLDTLKGRLPPVVQKDAVLLVRTSSTARHEPFLSEPEAVELDAMLLGQDLGYPVLNGYSAFAPPGYRAGPCASASERLGGYSRFMGGKAGVSDLARRLVILDLDPCLPGP